LHQKEDNPCDHAWCLSVWSSEFIEGHGAKREVFEQICGSQNRSFTLHLMLVLILRARGPFSFIWSAFKLLSCVSWLFGKGEHAHARRPEIDDLL